MITKYSNDQLVWKSPVQAVFFTKHYLPAVYIQMLCICVSLTHVFDIVIRANRVRVTGTRFVLFIKRYVHDSGSQTNLLCIK